VASGQFNELLPPYLQLADDTDVSLKSVNLPTGVRLEYYEKGLSSGTPVIFLHGYTDSWRSFEQVMPLLPESIHAYLISQRGHGESDRPANGYHPDDFASDVSDFMRELNIQSAIIVGHSMGATVAQRFALDYPYMAKALVLVGSFASFKTNQNISELQSFVDKIEDPLDSGFVSEFQKSTIFRPLAPSRLRTYVSESMKVPARVWQAAAKESLTVDYSVELKVLSMPVLILWGNKDNFCPESDQYILAKAIKNSTLLIYEGTGHAVHWEDPERFARDLVAFIDETQTEEHVLSEIDFKEHYLSRSFY
jgi:non-heme chloroperoxidase